MRTDLLKYDASSIQELLRRKLFETGLYTDQIYPGSDTRILIDLFAWTFEVLTYMLNNNVSDTLFEDTEIYENLNKIVKLLSYNPQSYKTSHAEFFITSLYDSDTTMTCTIPKYTCIYGSKKDNGGNILKYSFIKDYTFDIENGSVTSNRDDLILYNGEFTHYEFEQETQGSNYELFIMSEVCPDGDNEAYIDTIGLGIYLEKVNENGETIYTEIKHVDNLILEAGPNDLVCEMRFNEYKELTFKFGDNLHGKTLPHGGKLHIIYLNSNQDEGIIDSNELESNELRIEIKNISDFNQLTAMCYGGLNNFKSNYGALFENGSYINTFLNIFNITNSSKVKNYETVEEIKNNAPISFRIGNRLVTANDYRSYILTNFKHITDDVYVCNNFEYCMKFYKWLDTYNSLSISIRLENYTYASSCDFNNIYLWIKPSYEGDLINADKENIITECNKIKQITANLVPCNAIKTYFIPFIKNENFNINNETIDENFNPMIKIYIIKGFTYLSDGNIKTNVANIIREYFNEHNKLGDIINISELMTKIYSLDYINSIKVVSTDENQESGYSYISNLSFACFTPSLINNNDFEIINQIKELEPFQYAELLNANNLESLLDVVDDSTTIFRKSEF